MMFRSSRHPWYYWPSIVVVIELAWFGLLHPLVPSTFVGFVVEGLMPIPVLLYGTLAMRWIAWLQADRSIPRQALAVLIAVSLGAAIFFGAYFARSVLSTQFHYFIFRH
jgi:hypothetical protein